MSQFLTLATAMPSLSQSVSHWMKEAKWRSIKNKFHTVYETDYTVTLTTQANKQDTQCENNSFASSSTTSNPTLS